LRAKNTAKPAKSELGQQLGLTRGDERAAAEVVWSRTVARIGGRNRETAFLAGFLGLMLAMGFVFDWWMGRLGLSPPRFVKGAVISLLVTGGAIVILRCYLLPKYHAELARRGHNLCAACGYVRAGLAREAACPECGSSRGGVAVSANA
jgi:hypothetical protein